MAEAPLDDDLITKIRTLRELFSGRFDDSDAAFLLERNGNDVRVTACEILTAEPSEIRGILEVEKRQWAEVRRRGRGDGRLMERAKSGKIDTDVVMFACAHCDNFWWRRVPGRKKVSKCKKCHRKFDCLPRDKEWGWAEFHCTAQNCGRTFFGMCAMGNYSACYSCGTLVKPTRVLPPEKHRMRSRNQHSCNAPDCFSNQQRYQFGQRYRGGYAGYMQLRRPENEIGAPRVRNDDQVIITCVHPKSRRLNGLPAVVNSSEHHESTGSTVDTFLSQGDLMPNHFVAFLPPISEENIP